MYRHVYDDRDYDNIPERETMVDDAIDMDELAKGEESDIDEDADKEPDTTLGEESDIDDDPDKEPDSELEDAD